MQATPTKESHMEIKVGQIWCDRMLNIAHIVIKAVTSDGRYEVEYPVIKSRAVLSASTINKFYEVQV
jgi:hypothetical protein